MEHHWERPGFSDRQSDEYGYCCPINRLSPCQVLCTHPQAGLTVCTKAASCCQVTWTSMTCNWVFQPKCPRTSYFAGKTKVAGAPHAQTDNRRVNEMEQCAWHDLTFPWATASDHSCTAFCQSEKERKRYLQLYWVWHIQRGGVHSSSKGNEGSYMYFVGWK